MKNQTVYKILLVCVVLIISFVAGDLTAQCPMCRMSAETNLMNGGTEATSLNTGIIYLLSLPYILIGVLGYLWYTNKDKEEIE